MHNGKIHLASHLVRRMQFEISEKEGKVALLGTTIRDFDVMITELERQIATEEDRTGIKDTGHLAYSTFATAAAKRRQNLLISAEQMKSLLEVAKRELDEIAMKFRDLESMQNRPSQQPPAPANSTRETTTPPGIVEVFGRLQSIAIPT